MASTSHFFFLLSTIGCFLVGFVSADEHIVGGDIGWTLPSDRMFYQNWAQQRKFFVGDKLVFHYTPGINNVQEVTEEDFDNCTQESTILMYYKGPTTVTFSKPGKHYFYCGVGLHCEYGQKFSFTVRDP
ncbi:mavicyanin-like [Tasmannia lanceolata]|uniref:mavicyanin-like n=1 Tax=Tasmannia lanceolata TaxID=3420 RepID=UPI004063D57F